MAHHAQDVTNITFQRPDRIGLGAIPWAAHAMEFRSPGNCAPIPDARALLVGAGPVPDFSLPQDAVLRTGSPTALGSPLRGRSFDHLAAPRQQAQHGHPVAAMGKGRRVTAAGPIDRVANPNQALLLRGGQAHNGNSGVQLGRPFGLPSPRDPAKWRARQSAKKPSIRQPLRIRLIAQHISAGSPRGQKSRACRNTAYGPRGFPYPADQGQQ